MAVKNQQSEHSQDESNLDETKITEQTTDAKTTTDKTDETTDLVKVNQLLEAKVAELEKALVALKENQKKLMLATKVNTLKEQEIQNEDFRKYAKQRLIENSIIPVLLNFERALKFETTDDKVKNFLVGFQYIFTSLKDSLAKDGLSTINVKKGMAFNSHLCEVVATEWVDQLPEQTQDNMIIEVLASGYQLHSRTISPAKVKIIKLKQNDSNNDKNSEKE